MMISNDEKKKQIDWTDRFSYTQISSYLNCPRQYWFQYRAKAPKGTDDGRLLGTCLHSGIASLLEIKKNELETPPLSKESLKKLTAEARTLLAEEFDKLEGKQKKDGITREEIVYRYDRLIEAWAVEILPVLRPRKIEEPFAVEYEGIRLGGFIDLVDAKKGVIDWKCTKSRKEKGLEHSLQLALYSHVSGEMRVGFGSLLKPSALLRDKRKWEPKVYLDSTTLKEHQIKWALDVIVEVGRAIQDDKTFIRCSPESFLCREEFCDFWSLCRGAAKRVFASPSPVAEKKSPTLSFAKTKEEIRVHWTDGFDYVPEPNWVSHIDAPW